MEILGSASLLSHPVGLVLSNAAKLGGLDTTLFRETELVKLIIKCPPLFPFPPAAVAFPVLIADGDKIGGLWVGEVVGVFFNSEAELLPMLRLLPCPGFGEILLDFEESDDEDDVVEGSAGLDRLGICKTC